MPVMPKSNACDHVVGFNYITVNLSEFCLDKRAKIYRGVFNVHTKISTHGIMIFRLILTQALSLYHLKLGRERKIPTGISLAQLVRLEHEPVSS